MNSPTDAAMTNVTSQTALEVIENIRKASEGRADVDKYFPEINILESFEIDESMPEKERAFALWKNLLFAQRTSGQLFLLVGKLLKEFKEKELYIYLDYGSFNQFVSSPELAISGESAYMYIRVFEFYVEKLALDPETVRKMPLGKLSRMLPMIKEVEKELGKEKAIEKMNELNTLGLGDLSIEIKKAKGDSRDSYRPVIVFNFETNLWQVRYYEDKTEFVNAGKFIEYL